MAARATFLFFELWRGHLPPVDRESSAFSPLVA